MEDKKNLSIIAKQAGWRYAGEIIAQLFKIVNGILLANVLGPLMLGLYQLGFRCQQSLFTVTKMGLDVGLVRYIPGCLRRSNMEAKALLTYVLKIGTVCSIVFGFLMFALSDYVAIEIFNKPGLADVLRIFSFLVPLSTVNQLLMSANQGAKQLKYNVFFKQIVYSVVLFCVLGIMYFVGLNFRLVLMAIVLIEVISLILLLMSLKWTMNFSLTFGDMFKKPGQEMGVTRKELYDFSVPLLFHHLIAFLTGTVDVFMLSYFCPAETVGIYAVALNIAILISFVFYAFNEILMPVVAEKFAEKDYSGIGYLYQIITKWIFSVSLTLVGLVFLLDKDILLFFGEEYMSASTPLLILCTGKLIIASLGGVGYVLVSMGHQKLVLMNTFIALVLSTALNYFFIKEMNLDIVGAAVASTLSGSIMNCILVLQLKIKRGLQPFNMDFIKIIGAFIPAYLITYFTLNMIDVWHVWRIAIGTLLFMSSGSLAYYYFCITEEDKMILGKVREKLLLAGRP
ncbi:MAG: flippase [Nitrospirae bacterium]|nr:flippase [Nitrospirota bacterium]